MAQKNKLPEDTIFSQKVNELYFKKNVAPIFKSSCSSCYQGITDYAQALPKAQKY
ncbi:MAG: hypothetical protein ACRC0A_01455 [Chitinophagaceae bacterium]